MARDRRRRRTSARELDFPLLAALTVGTTLIVLIGSLLADVTLALLDPRVTAMGRAARIATAGVRRRAGRDRRVRAAGAVARRCGRPAHELRRCPTGAHYRPLVPAPTTRDATCSSGWRPACGCHCSSPRCGGPASTVLASGSVWLPQLSAADRSDRDAGGRRLQRAPPPVAGHRHRGAVPGQAFPAIIASIALTHWTQVARIALSEVLGVRGREYIDAAHLAGADGGT